MPRYDTPPPPCPHCSATHAVRNRANQSGTPKFLCCGCRHQFVELPKAGPVSQATRNPILRLPG